MATYVISDIHGYFYRFLDCLAQANFNPREDELYVLGDLTDRGPHSVEMLEWAYDAPSSVHFLMGNHEDMLLSAMRQFFDLLDEDDYDDFKAYRMIYNHVWTMWNGGLNTFQYLNNLPRLKVKDMLDWIDRWPLFYDITVQGRRFILVHAGLAPRGRRISDDSFSSGKHGTVTIEGIGEQDIQTLLWVRGTWLYDFNDYGVIVINGHTPTPTLYDNFAYDGFINENIEFKGGSGDIMHYCGKIVIDTGRSRMGMLRLDDMKEFYSEIQESED